MEYVTHIERRGREQGRSETLITLTARLVKRRFGAISAEIETKIKQLPAGKLEDLAEALLDFRSSEDLESWLYRNE